jgi:hypothetical protein
MNSSKTPQKNSARRSARLWEDSVVIAIRDFQWLELMRKNPFADIEGEPMGFQSPGGVTMIEDNACMVTRLQSTRR